MKIFSREQIARIDQQTKMLEPIAEIDLMERASEALADSLIEQVSSNARFAVVAGLGNNGGDALAAARILLESNHFVDVYLPELGGKRSEANQINLERLKMMHGVSLIYLNSPKDFLRLDKYDFLVDGLYGSGLNRPLDGFICEVISWMNASGVEIISIDLPSGLMCEGNPDHNDAIVRATKTLTLGFPKLSLFFSENAPFFGKWDIVQFGLHETAIEETETIYNLMGQSDVFPLLRRRNIFDHKGSYGHGLLLAGSKGKFGAAQLASRGALRAGLGLLTTHLPEAGRMAMQISLPEAMTSIDSNEDFITELPDLTKYSALAAGPGIGIQRETQEVVHRLLMESKVPLVLDADALNILANNPKWLMLLPENTILTPHPVEFDRLSGIVVKTDSKRLEIAEQFAISYRAIVILKGAFTRIIFPDGTVWFNSTGNPGMATAGSGDVLTGIILGLLCQGYTSGDAAKLGVFLHGRSADLIVNDSSQESLIASEIADYLGNAFASLKWR
jgi:NAD(P)H-hydrate epimerase